MELTTTGVSVCEGEHGHAPHYYDAHDRLEYAPAETNDTEVNVSLHPYDWKETLQFWFNSELFAVGLGSFVGCGVRVALNRYFAGSSPFLPSDGSEEYDSALQLFYDQKFLLANLLGSALMGMCMATANTLELISSPLSKGLTTGVCGSMTTFASWMNGVVVRYWGRDTGFRFVLVSIEAALTYCAFCCGFALVRMGKEIKGFLLGQSPFEADVELGVTDRVKRFFACIRDRCGGSELWLWAPLFLVIWVILWMLVIGEITQGETSVPFLHSRRDDIRAVALAPLGSWIRWGLARIPQIKAMKPNLNPQTLVVNWLGAVMGACASVWGGNSSWFWEKPFIDGVVGCMSTVSTLVAELHALYEKRSALACLRYTAVTFVGAVGLIHLVLLISAIGR